VTGGWAPRNAFQFETAKSGFTSRLADIVRAPSPELDITTLAARLVFGSPLTEATPYAGVRARYVRSHELERLEASAWTAAEAVACLRRALETSVAHALGDVSSRAAVLTGGGLDSAALLALAHAWGKRHGIKVFGVALDFGGAGDDRPYLAALERHLECEVVRVRPEDAAGRIDLFLRGVDAAPFTWPNGMMEVEALSRARAEGAEVVLTGIGADELVDGEPRSLGALSLVEPWAAIRMARNMRAFQRPRSPVTSWIVRPLVSRLVPRSVRKLRARRGHVDLPAWAGPSLRSHLEALRAGRPDATWERPYHEHLAWLRHQEDVAAGIECRQPFLERSMRELVASFPPHWLLQGAVRRGLFREAVRDLLPASVVERLDKAQFSDALERFIAAIGGAERLRPLASGSRLASLGLVDPSRLEDAFAELTQDPTSAHRLTSIWPVLAVEAFLRARDEGGSVA
jgi:asparagine synthase (glutamine-hydrolysing)